MVATARFTSLAANYSEDSRSDQPLNHLVDKPATSQPFSPGPRLARQHGDDSDDG